MVDKKVVDDYYSKVSTTKTSDDKKAPAKRSFKLKTKKVVVKKETSTSETVQKKETVKKVFVKKDEVGTKPVQKRTGMRVVRSVESLRKPTAEKGGEKKKTFKKPSGTGTGTSTRGVKKSFSSSRTPSDGTRRPFVKKTTSTSSGTSRFKSRSTSGTTTDNTSVKKEKVFTGNKVKGGNNNKYNTPKKSFLKPYNKAGKYNKRGYGQEPEDTSFSRSKKNHVKKIEKKVEDIKQNLTSREGETIIVGEILTLKELSEKIGINLVKLIAEFMKNGMMVNINSKIDFDSATIVASAFDVVLKRDNSKGLNVEDLMLGNILKLLEEDDEDKLEARPPIISIMGHVDHGKTSLLDYIRSTAVTDAEAGGITQSIGAYQVEKEGKKITFLDTPGHEAFTVMRARGVKSTDIAILVVAADEGMKPQTIESINHAKEADIPIIVAINKMDKEGANPEFVKGQLAEKGLTPEDWGGDTPVIPVSAHTGFGIDDLLEIVLLVAEMKELKANKDREGVATIIESHLDFRLGPVSTVLINTGTIGKGDNIVCNDSYGKIKILKNYENKNIKKAFPGDPVLIVGLDKVANGGDVLQVVRNGAVAKEKAAEYRDIILSQKRNQVSGLEVLMSRIKAGNLKQLKVVVKSDSNGSLEALKSALLQLSTPETNVTIIHSGVGNISQGDILMCASSKALLIGFGVDVIPTAKKTLSVEKVEFIHSKIIYHITERIEKIVSGMLDPKEVEIELGLAKVGGIFYTSNEFMILGLIVKAGDIVEPHTQVRILRKKVKIGEGKIESVKSGVEEVKSIEGPAECGIKFVSSVQPEMGDYLEIYKTEIH